MNDPDTIEQAAAGWRVRRDRGDWSAQDQAALDDWLAASTHHRVAWLRMDYGWRRIDRLAALRAPGTDVRPARPSRCWRRLRPAAAMAAVLALVAVGIGVVRLQGTGMQRHTTGVGGHAVVSLGDGSRLELNTDTRLRSAVDAHSRAVWLDRGEAYFEIAHDAARPFVVHVGNRRIVVLGTRFSVRRYAPSARVRDLLEVAVVDGRVRVEPPPSARRMPPAIATRGEIVIAETGATLVVPPSRQRVDSELAWRRGFLVFDDITLAQAVDEFNRYNRKKLIVDDPVAGGVRISGSFDATNVDAFVRLLDRAYGLRVRDRGDRIDLDG